MNAAVRRLNPRRAAPVRLPVRHGRPPQSRPRASIAGATASCGGADSREAKRRGARAGARPRTARVRTAQVPIGRDLTGRVLDWAPRSWTGRPVERTQLAEQSRRLIRIKAPDSIAPILAWLNKPGRCRKRRLVDVAGLCSCIRPDSGRRFVSLDPSVLRRDARLVLGGAACHLLMQGSNGRGWAGPLGQASPHGMESAGRRGAHGL